MGKVELHLQVDAELLARAEEKGVMLGDALEDGIRSALSRRADIEAEGDSAASKWADENADAIRRHNEVIAQRGIFGEDARRW
jgi:antitoxin CcdA